MTVGRPAALALPAYGSGSLSDLLPCVVSALTGGDGGVLRLDPVARAVVLLVDGLGWHQLRAHPQEAPFLTGLVAGGRRITAGCPATTATSLASLGTGLPPGRHGVLGYQLAVPGTDWVLSSLRWDDRIDPRSWQPEPTWFERGLAAGIAVTRVGPSSFDGTGLTVAALRGGRYDGADSVGERVAATAAALDAPRALVYCYHGDLDATGHRHGVGSSAWRQELVHVDRLVEQLAGAMPAGSALWVVADHGMVDVGADDNVDLAATPELLAGVRLVAGEPRARYLHVQAGAADDVLAAWRTRLGSRMHVVTRDEAVAAGWFGPVEPRLLARIGDVVALATSAVAVVDRRSGPRRPPLIGHHGSITPAELDVPLLEVRFD